MRGQGVASGVESGRCEGAGARGKTNGFIGPVNSQVTPPNIVVIIYTLPGEFSRPLQVARFGFLFEFEFVFV